jgi:hypothetical protein
VFRRSSSYSPIAAPQVVIGMYPVNSATAFWQQQARLAGLSLEQSTAFLTYALQRLDALSLAAAENFGLTRSQY